MTEWRVRRTRLQPLPVDLAIRLIREGRAGGLGAMSSAWLKRYGEKAGPELVQRLSDIMDKAIIELLEEGSIAAWTTRRGQMHFTGAGERGAEELVSERFGPLLVDAAVDEEDPIARVRLRQAVEGDARYKPLLELKRGTE